MENPGQSRKPEEEKKEAAPNQNAIFGATNESNFRGKKPARKVRKKKIVRRHVAEK